MASKEVKFSGRAIVPCPKCSNNTHFIIRSEQVSEAVCDIWAECTCGFGPCLGTTGNAIESIWGTIDENSTLEAIVYTWNDLLKQNPGPSV